MIQLIITSRRYLVHKLCCSGLYTGSIREAVGSAVGSVGKFVISKIRDSITGPSKRDALVVVIGFTVGMTVGLLWNSGHTTVNVNNSNTTNFVSYDGVEVKVQVNYCMN